MGLSPETESGEDEIGVAMTAPGEQRVEGNLKRPSISSDETDGEGEVGYSSSVLFLPLLLTNSPSALIGICSLPGEPIHLPLNK